MHVDSKNLIQASNKKKLAFFFSDPSKVQVKEPSNLRSSRSSYVSSTKRNCCQQNLNLSIRSKVFESSPIQPTLFSQENACSIKLFLPRASLSCNNFLTNIFHHLAGAVNPQSVKHSTVNYFMNVQKMNKHRQLAPNEFSIKTLKGWSLLSTQTEHQVR